MKLFINHKSNLSLNDIKIYEKKIRNLNIIIMPSLCYLSNFQKGKYILGSQDISKYDDNISGEVNGRQLKSLKVKYCLIGHSDNRILKKETKNTILKKIDNCYKNDILPIYCVGSELDLKNTLDDIGDIIKYSNNKKIIIAYEPKANIGAKFINTDIIEDNIKKIKNKYPDILLLYGGGINVDNLQKIISIKDLYGILISTEGLNYNNIKKLYKISRN